MQFQENFNKICEFPNYFENYSDADKEYEENVRKFNQEYEVFKKEHGLENLYFSIIRQLEYPADYVKEVYYEVTDLYLTYLEANNMLPRGAVNESFIIKDTYIYNTQKEVYFRYGMYEAIEQQKKATNKGNYNVYHSSSFIGLTERIKISSPSNGLPISIIDRIPMTYEDLIDPKIKQ